MGLEDSECMGCLVRRDVSMIYTNYVPTLESQVNPTSGGKINVDTYLVGCSLSLSVQYVVVMTQLNHSNQRTIT